MRFAAAAVALLAGCASATGTTPRQEADARALAEARPVGEPVDCIAIHLMRDSNARDDRTIDFFLADGRVMRNRLRNECPGLAFEDRFSYRTSLTRLCSTDPITVFTSDGARGPTCAIGTFQQVELPRSR